MKKAGIVVMVAGILMSLVTGFNIITKKKVVDFGAVEINRKEKTPIHWSPITGLIITGIGSIMIFAGKRK